MAPTAPNQTTARVHEWLDRPDNRAQVDTLVRAWNKLELLGIDLADQLEALVRDHVAKSQTEQRLDLDEVDWSYLAEVYAYEICGVTEEVLTKRRESASQ